MKNLQSKINEAVALLEAEYKYTGNPNVDFAGAHPLIPDVVAARVAEHEVEKYEDGDKLTKYLLGYFTSVYKANRTWAEKILNGRGNSGRDMLYSFMKHWADSFNKARGNPRDFDNVMKAYNDVYEKEIF